MKALSIRDAAPDDMIAVQGIYAHYVSHSLSSFEEIPPDIAEMSWRLKKMQEGGYPFRIAEQGGVIRGYAYAGQYRPRRAYRYTVENSVYVDPACRRTGIGGALLEDLIEQCTRRGFRQMLAFIGDRENLASISLHVEGLSEQPPGAQTSVLETLATRLKDVGARLEPMQVSPETHLALAPDPDREPALRWMQSLADELDPAGRFRSPTFPGRR